MLYIISHLVDVFQRNKFDYGTYVFYSFWNISGHPYVDISWNCNVAMTN